MEEEKLLQIMESYKQKAFDVFLENGEVSPVAFVFSKEAIGVMPLIFADDPGKKRAKLMLRGAAEKVNAEIVIIVSDAWIAFLKKGQSLPTMPVRNMADKKECIVVSASTKNKTIMMLTPLERSGSSIVLGETEIKRDVDDSFTGFMRQRVSGNAQRKDIKCHQN